MPTVATHAEALATFDYCGREFFRGFVECVEWAGTVAVEASDADGIELAGVQWPFAPECWERFREVCAKFLSRCWDDLVQASESRRWDHLGHDLFLSMGGHGTGFWDRGLGEVGDRLHKAARNEWRLHFWTDGEAVLLY